MSSNCSINCCSSPEITSSNVSVSNMNGVVSNEVSSGRIRTTVPDTKKDNKYWERRRRNNEAARRSREKRRQNDMVMDKRILELSQRNKQLENELFQLKMNFGLVNNGQTKLEIDDSSNKLITSTTVQETSNTINSSADHINGMVFPVFTAFPAGADTSEIMEKSNTDASNKSSSLLNDNPKSCMTPTKYPPNLITISNIPFLSNLISSPNFNEDITAKATLLLPSLVPKTPTKSCDPCTSSSGFSNSSALTVDGLTFNSTSDLSTDSKKRSVSVDVSQMPSSGNRLKIDFHDILDLSLKQENSDCFFGSDEVSPILYDRRDESNEVFDNDNKEVVTRSSPGNQSVDETMTNSFLSGIITTGPKEQLSVCTKRKLFPNSTLKRLNNDKTRRYNAFSDEMMELSNSSESKCHYNTIRHNLSLNTRLHIRREVSTIVINENRKLRRDIDSLSTEIKLLKSAMLECAKLSVNKPSCNHNSALSEQQQSVCCDLSDEKSGSIYVSCSSMN